MNPLLRHDATPLIRTDFSEDVAWHALRTAATTPSEDDFVANLAVVDDVAFRGFTAERIFALELDRSLVILADGTALTTPEHPLLVLRAYRGDNRSLRVVARELWSIENNISLGNMDWEEFADAADDDGVFRGFAEGDLTHE